MSSDSIDLRIRQATAEASAELARLRWDFSPDEVASGRQSYLEFREDFAEFLKESSIRGNWSVWVAESGARLIANAYLQIVSKVPRPGKFDLKWGYVTNVYVEPEF